MAVGITQTMAAATTAVPLCFKATFKETPSLNSFDKLVQALKDALGPSSGLTSDDVDVEHLTRLMQDYQSDEVEWSRFAFGDASRGYTRNLVDEGNGKSNLVSNSLPGALFPCTPIPRPSTTACLSVYCVMQCSLEQNTDNKQ